jgi:hypothetical protein
VYIAPLLAFLEDHEMREPQVRQRGGLGAVEYAAQYGGQPGMPGGDVVEAGKDATMDYDL